MTPDTDPTPDAAPISAATISAATISAATMSAGQADTGTRSDAMLVFEMPTTIGRYRQRLSSLQRAGTWPAAVGDRLRARVQQHADTDETVVVTIAPVGNMLPRCARPLGWVDPTGARSALHGPALDPELVDIARQALRDRHAQRQAGQERLHAAAQQAQSTARSQTQPVFDPAQWPPGTEQISPTELRLSGGDVVPLDGHGIVRLAPDGSWVVFDADDDG